MKRVTLMTLLFLTACGYGNLDYVKEHAEETFKSNGFEIQGYQGYQYGTVLPFTTYGGAVVWYTIKQSDSPIMYQAALKRWGDEIHIYSFTAKDAISPDN